MGLDQELHIHRPNVCDPDSQGETIAYWRKDWDLQDYIGSENCENIEIDIYLCDDILTNLDNIYAYRDYKDYKDYKDYTRKVFLQAKQLLEEGERIIYNGNW